MCVCVCVSVCVCVCVCAYDDIQYTNPYTYSYPQALTQPFKIELELRHFFEPTNLGFPRPHRDPIISVVYSYTHMHIRNTHTQRPIITQHTHTCVTFVCKSETISTRMDSIHTYNTYTPVELDEEKRFCDVSYKDSLALHISVHMCTYTSR